MEAGSALGYSGARATCEAGTTIIEHDPAIAEPN